LWSIEEVAEYLALSPKTLYGWRCRKYGPPSYRLGNQVRYRPEEVRAWVDAQSVLAS
jgi:excisionase family DNA binding protein